MLSLKEPLVGIVGATSLIVLLIVTLNNNYDNNIRRQLRSTGVSRKLRLPVDPKSVYFKSADDTGHVVSTAAAGSTSTDNAQRDLAATEIPEFNGYKNVWDPRIEGNNDMPVFWHIPRSGGSTVKEILGTCHQLTMATEAGVANGHDQDTQLGTFLLNDNEDNNDLLKKRFVNVDTTTAVGLERAKAMGLGNSGLTNIVASIHHIYKAESLFIDTDGTKGRLFTIMRDPIDRAISMYNFLKNNNPENPVATLSLAQYVKSSYVENNWMTRYLINKIEGDLYEQDVIVAMDVLRRKFLVGLFNHLDASMERFEKYFNWQFVNSEKQEEAVMNQELCRTNHLQLTTMGNASTTNAYNIKALQRNKPEIYQILVEQNKYDLQLYEYVQALFVEQAALVHWLPDEYRLYAAGLSTAQKQQQQQEQQAAAGTSSSVDAAAQAQQQEQQASAGALSSVDADDQAQQQEQSSSEADEQQAADVAASSVDNDAQVQQKEEEPQVDTQQQPASSSSPQEPEEWQQQPVVEGEEGNQLSPQQEPQQSLPPPQQVEKTLLVESQQQEQPSRQQLFSNILEEMPEVPSSGKQEQGTTNKLSLIYDGSYK